MVINPLVSGYIIKLLNGFYIHYITDKETVFFLEFTIKDFSSHTFVIVTVTFLRFESNGYSLFNSIVDDFANEFGELW